MVELLKQYSVVLVLLLVLVQYGLVYLLWPDVQKNHGRIIGAAICTILPTLLFCLVMSEIFK